MSTFTPTFAAPQSLHPGCPGLLAAQRRTCEAEPRPITAAVWDPWNFTAGDGWATYRPRASWVDICIHVNYVDAVAALKLILLSLNFRVHTCRNCSRWASPNILELAHTNLQANDIETLFFLSNIFECYPKPLLWANAVNCWGPVAGAVTTKVWLANWFTYPGSCTWRLIRLHLCTVQKFRRNTRPCGWKSWKSQHKNAHVTNWRNADVSQNMGRGPDHFHSPSQKSPATPGLQQEATSWTHTTISWSRYLWCQVPSDARWMLTLAWFESWGVPFTARAKYHGRRKPRNSVKVYSSRAGIIIRMKHSRWRPSEYP